MTAILGDARYALRSMRKKPLPAAIAILSLAIGIGANATIFVFLNSLLFRPLPVREPNRLIEVFQHRLKARNSFTSYSPLSYPDYAYYRDHNTVFNDLAALAGEPQNASWMRDGEGHEVAAQMVSENFFRTIGIAPAAGRFFAEKREPPCAVIGYALWQRIGADPAILGTTMNINGHALTVIGVTPKGFNGLVPAITTDLWIPLRDASSVGVPVNLEERHWSWLIAIGRLKDGVNPRMAEGDIQRLGQQLAAAYPDSNKDTVGATFAAQLIPGPFRKLVITFGSVLLMLVTMVLLIGCANAANVLLAQASGRTREVAVRAALGASRLRLIRQTLTESVLLASVSGIAGYVAAMFAGPLLLALRPANFQVELEVVPDWRVALFAFLVALAAGLVFGILPALRASKMDLAESIKTGTAAGIAGTSRLRSALIAAQFAVCAILLVAGGFSLAGLQAARNIRPGFNPDRVFASSVHLGPFHYTEDQGTQFFHTLTDRLRRTPGVDSVALADHLPLGGIEKQVTVKVAGETTPALVSTSAVSPGYFHTMRSSVLRGREFAERDSAQSLPVAIINEAMAARLWRGQDPIGKAFQMDSPDQSSALRVIGVVETGKYRSLGEPPTAFFFRPLAQSYSDSPVVVVRTLNDPARFSATFREVLRDIDPRLAQFGAGTMRQQMEAAWFTTRVLGLFLGVSGLFALLLAIAGVYGVIAFLIAQRTREIAVRVALGARSSSVLTMIMGHSLKLASIGVLIGTALSVLATRVLSDMVYSAHGPSLVLYAAVPAGLLLMAALATYIPGRAVLSVDPASALKYD
jgi:predicted permease